CLHSGLKRLGTMRSDGYIFCQCLLNKSLVRRLIMSADDRLDLFLRLQCEYFDPVLSIVVTGVQPKLVVFKRRSFLWIQPYGATLRFPKFSPVCLLDQLGR